MVLTPDKYEWQDTVVNLYEYTDLILSAPVGITIVRHGHDRSSTCFATTLCHVLGYIPVGPDNFMKRWKEKWDEQSITTSNYKENF